MECSRCAAGLDKQYSYCPSCGFDTKRDYVITCMDELGLILFGHPNWDRTSEVWPGDWEIDHNEADIGKLYSKIEKANQTLQAWFEEKEEKWSRLIYFIAEKDQKLREQWNKDPVIIEEGLELSQEDWKGDEISLVLGAFRPWPGSHTFAAVTLKEEAFEYIKWAEGRYTFADKKKSIIVSLELERLKKEMELSNQEKKSIDEGVLSKFDQLLNSTTSLIAVGLGVVLFLFSSMMIGEVSGAECTVGSSISIEMQDRCTSLANTAKYSMWGGIVSVLYGWYSK